MPRTRGSFLRAALAFLALPALAAPTFLERTVKVEGQVYGYRVFVPGAGAKPRPVVLFLHGSGERGSDNRSQLSQGLPPWLEREGAAFPAVVVIPQAPPAQAWSGPAATAAMAALHAAITEFQGDPGRVYLTGLSMGGYGSWELLMAHPGEFAAAAIVCGGIEPLSQDPAIAVHGLPPGVDPFAHIASRIGGTPVWLFHGADDTVVPPDQSRRMAAALKAAGVEARATEYPGVGHGSWARAYATGDLWPWMFGHASVGRLD